MDLFSDDTLNNTSSSYKRLRDTGSVVHLPRNDLYAITQFESVQAALRADDILLSGHGVAANDFINGTSSEATITSDGATHVRRRKILAKPLGPKSLETVKQRISDSADALIRNLLAGDEFCAVKDFASHLPVTIVAELVGLEEEGRENMLEWAAATFDALGPMNDRTTAALQTAIGLIQYTQQLGQDRVKPDGWAARILGYIDTGEISESEAAMMVVDYVAPSLDTTILASAHMLWRLATTAGVYDALKEDPELLRSMVYESVRLASPIRGFTRYVDSDYETESGTIPSGSRVAVLYASANWDERRYPDADQFQIDRNPRDHLGWGHGTHICAGMHLARLEMEALASALIRHVDYIETGDPKPIMNNVLQGFAALPAKFR
ncbi:MAG: cytochrome P450 [Pseudomonadota bacterium]